MNEVQHLRMHLRSVLYTISINHQMPGITMDKFNKRNQNGKPYLHSPKSRSSSIESSRFTYFLNRPLVNAGMVDDNASRLGNMYL